MISNKEIETIILNIKISAGINLKYFINKNIEPTII